LLFGCVRLCCGQSRRG